MQARLGNGNLEVAATNNPRSSVSQQNIREKQISAKLPPPLGILRFLIERQHDVVNGIVGRLFGARVGSWLVTVVSSCGAGRRPRLKSATTLKRRQKSMQTVIT